MCDMDVESLRGAGAGYGWLWLQPFWYIALVSAVFRYRAQIAAERRLFGVRLHRFGRLAARTVLEGAAVGVVASGVSWLFGIRLSAAAGVAVWICSVAGALVRPRFACVAYACAGVGVAHAVATVLPAAGVSGVWPDVVRELRSIDMASLLALVALLHAAEAVLVTAGGAKTAMPLFLMGRRGKVVGGFAMHRLWAVPLVLAVSPSQGWATAWMPFPVLLGYAERTTADLPARKARRSAVRLAAYAVVTGGFAAAAAFWRSAAVGFAGALAAAVLHEALIRLSHREERLRAPLFVHDGRGVRVLAVVPGSPAEAMGIRTGEVISKVNGITVRDRRGLYAALWSNPTLCRLEVLDEQGQVRFLQRPFYAGEQHQLGLVLCPDEDAPYLEEIDGAGWKVLFGIPRRTASGPRRPG